MTRHGQSKLRPQSDHGLKFYPLIGHQSQFPPTSDRRKQQNTFSPSESFADASSHSATEGEVNAFLDGLFYAAVEPTLRPKLIR
jgi:hypothetical protein